MATVALAVGGRGVLREVAGGGYRRAEGAPQAGGPIRFPTATGTWGIVRAWGVVDDAGAVAWQPLAAPLLVAAGERASLDLGDTRAGGSGVLTVAGGGGTPGGGSGMAALTARPHDPRVTGAGAREGGR